MVNFAAFIDDIEDLLKMIKQKTGKIFIPIVVNKSPVNPKTECILVLRTSDNVQGFPLSGWYTPDLSKLSKKFQVRDIQVDLSQSADFVKYGLTDRLAELHTTE